MTVRILVRVANYAEGDAHLHSFRTVDVESPELEALLSLGYGNRAHAEVIGAERLTIAPEPRSTS